MIILSYSFLIKVNSVSEKYLCIDFYITEPEDNESNKTNQTIYLNYTLHITIVSNI